MGVLPTVLEWENYRFQNNMTSLVVHAAQQGFAPFKPSPMDIRVEQSLSFRPTHLVVEFPSVNLEFKAALDEIDLIGYPESLYMQASEQLFHQIRYRETLPVPSNIVLGED